MCTVFLHARVYFLCVMSANDSENLSYGALQLLWWDVTVAVFLFCVILAVGYLSWSFRKLSVPIYGYECYSAHLATTLYIDRTKNSLKVIQNRLLRSTFFLRLYKCCIYGAEPANVSTKCQLDTSAPNVIKNEYQTHSYSVIELDIVWALHEKQSKLHKLATVRA